MLGIAFDYDIDKKLITLAKGDSVAELTVGSDEALLDGQTVKLAAPLRTRSGSWPLHWSPFQPCSEVQSLWGRRKTSCLKLISHLGNKAYTRNCSILVPHNREHQAIGILHADGFLLFQHWLSLSVAII